MVLYAFISLWEILKINTTMVTLVTYSWQMLEFVSFWSSQTLRQRESLHICFWIVSLECEKKCSSTFKPKARLRKLLNTVSSNIYKFSLMVLREKEGFGKITKNNIISIILLIPRWLGWTQNQHPPCHYWADLCSCHFLFGYSQLVAQDTDACPPRAHLAATHFFSNCSITASKSSYSFVLSSFWASVSCFWALEAAALSYQSWKCSKPF